MTDPLRPDRATDPAPARRRGLAHSREAFVSKFAGVLDYGVLKQAVAALVEERLAEIAGQPRWVPIGPSVALPDPTVAQGQLSGWTRQSGRIRDIQVNAAGTRAYAGSAKGGVWYTGDAGATWAPVGGWAERARLRGGGVGASSAACLLVEFGSSAADDIVLVGTGEFVRSRPARPSLLGVGVLSARGPAAHSPGGDPWDEPTGQPELEGKGILHLARRPDHRMPSGFPAEVLAATSGGLFRGTRNPADVHWTAEHYDWTPVPALDRDVGYPAGSIPPFACDVLWLPGATADGVIVVAVAAELERPGSTQPLTSTHQGSGVLLSTDGGLHFHWIGALDSAQRIVGRMSLANTGNRVYVLGAQWSTPPPTTPPLLPDATVWRIPDITAPSPAATALSGVPPGLWAVSGVPDQPEFSSQRDYDQAIAVHPVGADDRVLLGGNWNHALNHSFASLWCFEVPAAGAGGVLTGIANISNAAAGTPVDGWIGPHVHADVHCVRVAGTSGHVWVGCDGGVYVSTEQGTAFTFAPRVTGLAALEVNFVASHPTSSHFVAIGTQDNGAHVRVGDVVWWQNAFGDAGGVAFHPRRSHIVVSQVSFGTFAATARDFTQPLSHTVDQPPYGDRENLRSAFYSGVAATTIGTADAARFALGTDRVWITENLDGTGGISWRVLPYLPAPGAAAADPRPRGSDPPARRGFGVPQGAPLAAGPVGADPLGPVHFLKWASETELLVIFERGLVRWTRSGASWSARLLIGPTGSGGVLVAGLPAGAPDPANTVLSDLAPVPGGHDFYLATTGRTGTTDETCLYFADGSPGEFRPTGLRAQLAPLDPAHAVVVDPDDATTVYVGTVSAVWRGVRAATSPPSPSPVGHTWTPMVNGLPDALVQDLSVFHDPARPGGPRLLRAGIQSRGVWELDLTSNPAPAKTYLRVHARDDRRQLPTPLHNPRRRPGATTVAHSSPDIVVRPQPGRVGATPPGWQFGPTARLTGSFTTPDYQLWTFQTAFRWHHPSIFATGLDSAPLRQMVARHRAALHLTGAYIDRDLWRAVMAGTLPPAAVAAGLPPSAAAARLDPATFALSTDPAHPLAVYQSPWLSAATPTLIPTEVDLLEGVLPPRIDSAANEVWEVFLEPNTVDVLVHHRDTHWVEANDAFVILLWRHKPSQAQVLAADTDTALIPDFVATLLNAELPGAPAPARPVPALTQWSAVPTGSGPLGTFVHRVGTQLDARMPRAVSIDIDFTAGPSAPVVGSRVALLAIAGSVADLCTVAAVGVPTPPAPPAVPAALAPADLVRAWPYTALRVVKLVHRPAGRTP